MTGTVRAAVEVDYHGHKFYLDDEGYPEEPDAGWHKVTVGIGGPDWGHKSLPVERVLESWAEVVDSLRSSYGREPTLEELLEKALHYDMTPDEVKAQAESWARQDMD